ncbi:MAG TPA: hypothetical protein VJ570_10535 [Holophagaceae bacterium]|nr:hypothetical protein [Holophagaceae bacterium]
MALRKPPLSLQARALVALMGVLAVLVTAPWPRLQLILHVLTVVALAPDPRSYLVTGLLASASGWALEGSLKLYPRLGGSPWAALTIALVAAFLAEHWPPESRFRWMIRLLGLAVGLFLLTQTMVFLAAGSLPTARPWAWVLLGWPLWAYLTWRDQPARP